MIHVDELAGKDPNKTPQNQTKPNRICTRGSPCSFLDCATCKSPWQDNHHIQDLSQASGSPTSTTQSFITMPPAPPNTGSCPDKIVPGSHYWERLNEVEFLMKLYNLAGETQLDFINFDHSQLRTRPQPSPGISPRQPPQHLHAQPISMKPSRMKAPVWNKKPYDFYLWLASTIQLFHLTNCADTAKTQLLQAMNLDKRWTSPTGTSSMTSSSAILAM